MAGMNPERKSQDAIEQANRKMLQEHDKRLEKWRENRLNSIERDRETPSRNVMSAPTHK
ncbi:hypothetical protein ACYG9Z_01145 [Mesorhizobium sp. RSR380A]|uniref:hypothetical protein n=1 Tax=Mesorhizobium sp. LNJC380A00 TaxID=1287264 RepID=UPI0012EC2F4B|nr:hypothetical protein [Mesorhizobium sp. LNJC380A00]